MWEAGKRGDVSLKGIESYKNSVRRIYSNRK
jgi:hypothetical protein